jgi:hypothetical protein
VYTFFSKLFVYYIYTKVSYTPDMSPRKKTLILIDWDQWACSAGYKPTLLQLFGLLQLQSIERKIL